MEADARKKIQIFLAIAIAVAAARTAYILYERKTESQQVQKETPPLNPDYYVTPKKLYPYDLKSAKQLTRQPAWVKLGYSIAFYPYSETQHRSDFAHEKGTLGPIQKLDIKNVVLDASPGNPGQHQIMALFQQDGRIYSFPIGAVKNGNYHFYSDDMLFIQDPHELYKHWPADIWAAIDKHEAKAGMNQLQVGFALGLGSSEGSGDTDNGTMYYANGGKPISVTYSNGKTVEVKAGQGS
ncbi:MAG TPA: hypothetical protein VN684_10645 [Terriglobales bacterium]|nr:hypothetical protein [Terriglobales bacterium]